MYIYILHSASFLLRRSISVRTLAATRSAEAPAAYAFNENPSAASTSVYKALPAAVSTAVVVVAAVAAAAGTPFELFPNSPPPPPSRCSI